LTSCNGLNLALPYSSSARSASSSRCGTPVTIQHNPVQHSTKQSSNTNSSERKRTVQYGTVRQPSTGNERQTLILGTSQQCTGTLSKVVKGWDCTHMSLAPSGQECGQDADAREKRGKENLTYTHKHAAKPP
jgi:hypothetical protein